MKRKRKFSGLLIPFIVAIVAFLGYQYFMADTNREAYVENVQEAAESNREASIPENDYKEPLTSIPAVQEYVNFVKEGVGSDAKEENYTKEAATHLVNALGSLAMDDVTLIDREEVNNLRTQLDKYENTQTVEKTKELKELIDRAAGILLIVQNHNVALEEDLKKLRQDADAISANTSAQEQGEKINEFFDQAAVVLGEAERSM